MNRTTLLIRHTTNDLGKEPAVDAYQHDVIDNSEFGAVPWNVVQREVDRVAEKDRIENNKNNIPQKCLRHRDRFLVSNVHDLDAREHFSERLPINAMHYDAVDPAGRISD